MMVPTPVTTSTMTIESASIESAKSRLSEPETIQPDITFTSTRSDSASPSRWRKSTTATTNDVRGATQPMKLTRPSRGPRFLWENASAIIPLMSAPASGASGTMGSSFSID
jgi:hypothetical protein